MIGSKSLITNIIIPNEKSDVSFEVIVQANKNYGICDVLLPNMPKEPKAPHDTSNGELVRAYNEAKKQYMVDMTEFKARRSRILNVVQGCQMNDPEVYSLVADLCAYELNKD